MNARVGQRGRWRAVLLLAIVAIVVLADGLYTVNEGEQVIVTQFGKIVGLPITNAGLHFKAPFIQTVNRLEKRVLPWDGPATEMPTKDKTYIIIDAFGRWRIKDPAQFFIRLRDERSALSRLDDIVGSEIRNTVAKHELIELIRTTKDRQPSLQETVGGELLSTSRLPPITKGRAALEREILEAARPKLEQLGIELLDVQFKRVNYNPTVQERIYERMISERRQIAERFRSEGQGEAARIAGEREKELSRIQSEAYRQSQQIIGAAEAKAIEVYAAAYNRTAEARQFYRFLQSLEALRRSLTNSSEAILVLSTDNELLEYLQSPDRGFDTRPAN